MFWSFLLMLNLKFFLILAFKRILSVNKVINYDIHAIFWIFNRYSSSFHHLGLVYKVFIFLE